MSDTLSMFVLYKHPSDYPTEYVIREHVIIETESVVKDGEPFYRNTDLDKVHEFMSGRHLIYMLRSLHDDPCIMGTYI